MILGRRADGYHEVRTVLQTVSLHDQLHFSSRDDSEIVLSCDDSSIPHGAENLVTQAASALRAHCGVALGATIHLQKRIPVQAGLGGASSNAAVTLLGLARLWQLQMGVVELTRIGTRLGADVPFFFWGGCALATGIGADVTPLSDTPLKHLLILKPGAAVATADAYRALSARALTTSEDASILSVSCAEPDFDRLDQRALQNDFEPAIFAAQPEIENARRALIESGAVGAMLAGSGSCVFGIFDNKHAQQSALQEIRADAGWKIFSAVTMSRQEYLLALGSGEGALLRSVSVGPDTGA